MCAKLWNCVYGKGYACSDDQGLTVTVFGLNYRLICFLALLGSIFLSFMGEVFLCLSCMFSFCFLFESLCSDKIV